MYGKLFQFQREKGKRKNQNRAARRTHQKKFVRDLSLGRKFCTEAESREQFVAEQSQKQTDRELITYVNRLFYYSLTASIITVCFKQSSTGKHQFI